MSDDDFLADSEPQAVAVPMSTMEVMSRSEMDMQITTARRYPRSMSRVMTNAKMMATMTEDIAASCMFSLPRGGKPIEGPSVRLAEIMNTAYGNTLSGARIVDDDGTFITAQGVFHDLEQNVRITTEVKRKVTNRDGKRFTDDMIVVTSNAACAIASRNAILKGIPRSFTEVIYQAARETAIGTAETMAGRRAKALLHFSKMGVTPDRIFKTLGVGGEEDIGLDELGILRGFVQSIKDNEISVDEAFPPISPLEKVPPKAKEAARPADKPTTPTEAPANDLALDGDPIAQAKAAIKSVGLTESVVMDHLKSLKLVGGKAPRLNDVPTEVLDNIIADPAGLKADVEKHMAEA